MADTVTTQIIQDGPKNAVIKFTNISDGTGESAVDKVIVGNLSKLANGQPCTEVALQRVQYYMNGMDVTMNFSVSSGTAGFIAKLNENDLGDMDFRDYSGIPNTTTNKNGNISFTTSGHSAGDTYTIILTLLKA
tara:strand:- start:733 stop:1134 length:402 start_codon:yes stop_codon:yes gene_type:complete